MDQLVAKVIIILKLLHRSKSSIHTLSMRSSLKSREAKGEMGKKSRSFIMMIMIQSADSEGVRQWVSYNNIVQRLVSLPFPHPPFPFAPLAISKTPSQT